jgi:plastocyanin
MRHAAVDAPGRVFGCLALWLLALIAPGRVLGASLTVVLTQPGGEPLAGAIVTARNLAAPAAMHEPIAAVMDQVNRRFTPEVLVIPVGSTVSFPNTDRVSHQVYSFSPVRPFKLPLYRGQPYPPVRFESPGLVTLGCNIHDDMVGYIWVTDARDYGTTDARGAWTAATLAAGDYEISLWHPRMREEDRELHRRVQLGSGDRVEVRVQLTRAVPPVRGPSMEDY